MKQDTLWNINSLSIFDYTTFHFYILLSLLTLTFQIHFDIPEELGGTGKSKYMNSCTSYTSYTSMQQTLPSFIFTFQFSKMSWTWWLAANLITLYKCANIAIFHFHFSIREDVLNLMAGCQSKFIIAMPCQYSGMQQ